VPFVAQSAAACWLYFASSIPATYDEVMACDKERFNRFYDARPAST
jgi:glutamate-1-semialdehyde 2,1-aminomutase